MTVQVGLKAEEDWCVERKSVLFKQGSVKEDSTSMTTCRRT